MREGGAGGGAEEAVGLGEDVALVGDGDQGAAAHAGGIAHPLAAECNVACHFGDAERGTLGDALDGLGDLAIGGVVRLLLLDVEVFCVLADDDEVDGVGEFGRGLDRFHGPDVGVEVEAFAEAHDGRGIALCWGRGGADCSEEGTVAGGFEGFDGGFGEGGTRLLETVESSVEVGELEFQV